MPKNNTKVALISDLHWGVRSDSPIFIDIFKQFYHETFFPYLKKHDINTVLILGDVFDKRQHTNHKTIKACREILFDVLSEENIKTYILIGNHDTMFKDTLRINSIDLLLSHYTNISIIHEPCTINILGHDVCMIPWICRENEEDCMKEINNTKSDLVMGHFEFARFEFFLGQESKEGLEPELFSRFKHVYTGHYHHSSTRNNITYLGCPYQMTWNDYNDMKGFYVLDLKTKKSSFVNNPISSFVRFDYNEDDKESIESFLNNNSNLKNTFIKIYVIKKKDHVAFESFIQAIYQRSCHDVKIVENLSELIKEDKDNPVDIQDEIHDTQTTLMMYIDNLSLEESNKIDVKDYIKSLYLDAITEEVL